VRGRNNDMTTGVAFSHVSHLLVIFKGNIYNIASFPFMSATRKT